MPEARQELDTALKPDLKASASYLLRAEVLDSLNLQKAGIADLKTAIGLKPDCADAYSELSLL
ncbi:MAG: hypothetical protein ACREP9_06925 [Candidatus Dormibacteraceae bacterium]